MHKQIFIIIFLQTFFISFWTSSFIIIWQFGQFALFTQLLSVYAIFGLGYIDRMTFRTVLDGLFVSYIRCLYNSKFKRTCPLWILVVGCFYHFCWRKSSIVLYLKPVSQYSVSMTCNSIVTIKFNFRMSVISLTPSKKNQKTVFSFQFGLLGAIVMMFGNEMLFTSWWD